LKRHYEKHQGNEQPFRTFEDLEVYKNARQFRKSMYAVTRKLPDFERYELSSQLRRAAVSLTNNIAEEHGRYHFLDQIRFMLHSRGSLEELLDELNVCIDERYLPPEKIDSLKQQGWRVRQLIDGYVRYLQDRKFGPSLRVNETAGGEEFFSELDLRSNNSTI
jgi:four helix bundle protein